MTTLLPLPLLRAATITRMTAQVVARIYPDLRVFELALQLEPFRMASAMQIAEAVVGEYEYNGNVIADPPGFPADVELRASVVRFFAEYAQQWRNGR